MKRACSLKTQTRMNPDVHRDKRVPSGLKNKLYSDEKYRKIRT